MMAQCHPDRPAAAVGKRGRTHPSGWGITVLREPAWDLCDRCAADWLAAMYGNRFLPDGETYPVFLDINPARVDAVHRAARAILRTYEENAR